MAGRPRHRSVHLQPGLEVIPGIMPFFKFGSTPANTVNPNLVGIPWFNLNRNWDFTENISWIKGKHQIKVGRLIHRPHVHLMAAGV